MTDPSDPALERLLEHIKRERRFDFAGYKRTTLERRLHKRMAAVHVEDYEAYLDVLQVRLDEFDALFDTLLINVTSFFRDREAWDALRALVLPRILDANDGETPIRLWSAGCASGEEPYTLAMLVAELIGLEALTRRVKIYATDADTDALAQARRPTYDANAVAPVPPDMLSRYFEAAGDRFALRKEIRRCVILGPHDLIQDPPISRIDVLVCRNTLMYMNADTQERILRRLHFALNDTGVLMLGKAEMLLAYGDLFEPLDLQHRIFAKVPRDVLARAPRRTPRDEPTAVIKGDSLLRERAIDASPVAQIVVGLDGHVSLVNQRASEMFGLGSGDVGRPLQDLELSYRPVELRSVIDHAYEEHRSIVLRDIERVRGGELSHFDIHVSPISDRSGSRLGAQVSFVDITRAVVLQRQLSRSNGELQAAFGDLQCATEELETTNEELQSTVEELETTNEELHSTNEELETMNEELHSTNAELQTLNSELEVRSRELADTNVFLESVLASFRGAIVVVDRDLRVQRWNSAARALWGVRADDAIGKTLVELGSGFPVDAVAAILRDCFASGLPRRVPLNVSEGVGPTATLLCSPLGRPTELRGAVLILEPADDGGRAGSAPAADA